MTFLTAAIAPIVTTNAATGIAGTTATVNGTVNANNASTTVTFDYGLTTTYGTTVTAIQSPVTGTSNTPVSYNLSGLIPNSLYHFRVNGSSIGGTVNGGDLTFTTLAIPPVAVTNAASSVGTNSATLNGTVTANNASSNVTFDYGLTTTYGTTIPGSPSPVTGMTPLAVLANITSLNINTQYHFRVCAANVAGSSCGNDQTFTTGCPLPSPAGTITGPVNVCKGIGGYVYTVPPITNATGYTWTLPPNASVTFGGNTNSITVSYALNSSSGNVTVAGTNVCGSGGSSSLAVTVNPLPVVTITGPSSVCVATAGSVYTTQAGMSNYTWSVSLGGTITGGGTTNSNTVTVTWNTIGAQTVSINYTNSAGCTATAPTVYNVTVNARPTPTISGPNPVCTATPGSVYTTQAGMTNYVWTTSGGGTVTGGGTTSSNTITITWNAPGTQSVIVNYTNSNGCSAISPVTYLVTVNARPTPTLSGPVNVCAGTTGNVYTTDAGMTNYLWTVSVGGSITGGGTTSSNTVTVTWNTAGAQSVSINYTNPSGCQAAAPVSLPVTVSARPVPAITGPSVVCSGTSGNVYSTQVGMTNYIWNVSAGGTVTSGGTTSSNTVTVKWNTAGSQTVSVNYTNAGNCTATSPTIYPVTVNQTPSPTITGSNNLCVNSGYYNYSTETGMTNYVWTISSGGTINYGSGTYQITVTWHAAGSQTVSVNYSTVPGCSAPVPTSMAVSVNPPPGPAGPITGIPSVCAGDTGISYSVAPISNATTYLWTLPQGATISYGAGTRSIKVNFAPDAISGNMTVQGNNLCGNGTISSPYPVIVVPLPAAAGTVTGPDSICQGEVTVAYSVPPITHATGYVWTVPPGAIIVQGINTHSILVDFPASNSGIISVYGTDYCGNGQPSPDFPVVVSPIPPAPVITANGDTLQSDAPAGNQWYFNNSPITGATGQTWIANQSGIYYCIVTLNGCISDSSNHLYIIITEAKGNTHKDNIRIYPNPGDGFFTLLIEGSNLPDRSYDLSIVNTLGVQVFDQKNLQIRGSFREEIDLRSLPGGVYTYILGKADHNITGTIIIYK